MTKEEKVQQLKEIYDNPNFSGGIMQIIMTASKFAPQRSMHEVLAQGMEELGEIATEINIATGFKDRPHGKDGIIGECVDLINVLGDLIYIIDPTISIADIDEISKNKCIKWIEKSKR